MRSSSTTRFTKHQCHKTGTKH